MDTGIDTVFSMASRSMKYSLSFAVFFCCFIEGVILTFLNPTVIGFSNKFDTTVDQVSVVFTVITVCFCVGALTYGVLNNFVDRQIILIFLIAGASAAFFAFPYVTSITTFFVLGGVVGFAVGGMDTAQVAWIMDIWRHDAGPYFLAQNFAYSLGTLVPPLLLAPYLSNEPPHGGTTTEDSSTPVFESTTKRSVTSDLYIPFTAAGSAVAVVAVVLVVLYFVLRRAQNAEISNNNERNPQNLEYRGDLWRRKVIIMVLACTFLGFYSGMETCTMSFLPTFAHFSEVRLSETESATVLLWLTIGYTIGRGLGIVAILKVAPQYILCVNFVLILAGNTILVTVGGSSEPWLWVGSILLGLGFSTTYPAFYVYLEKYIFVSDSIAATVGVFTGVICAIYPLIVGHSVEKNPRILNYVDYFSFGMAVLSFLAVFKFTYNRNEPEREREREPKLLDHTE